MQHSFFIFLVTRDGKNVGRISVYNFCKGDGGGGGLNVSVNGSNFN